MSEIPEMDYERADGGLIREGWAGREVEIPAEWVRAKAGLPVKYAFASFGPSVREGYREVVARVASRYVRDWPVNRQYGTGLFLTGESGAGKTFAAAAVVNEILGRYTHGTQFDVVWLPVAWRLQELFDHRHFGRAEEYGLLRRRLLNCDLLVVDDLTHAANFPSVKEFLFGLYDYRDQQRKPTVTTANAVVTAEDWSALEQAFNGPFVRRLRDNARGFTAVV